MGHEPIIPSLLFGCVPHVCPLTISAIQLQNPRLTIRVTVLFILTAETQKLKHAVSKGDKKKRKEVMAKIAKMEEDQAEKHKLELEQLNQVKHHNPFTTDPGH